MTSSGIPIKNGKSKPSSYYYCFPSEIAVIKTEAHTKRIKPEYKKNAPADLHAKAT